MTHNDQWWFERPRTVERLNRLQAALADNGRVIVFLGAGLSFGAARLRGRERFDQNRYPRPYFKGEPIGYPFGPYDDDDGLPLPSWAQLVSRMLRELQAMGVHEEGALLRFFHDQGPLDCAQLFAQTIGPQRYREFLQRQFDARRHGFIDITPSHEALVELDLRLLFTTNFDELIEQAYVSAGHVLRVSATEAEFKARLAERPDRHLVKLHGSIDRPDTIILTRDDYARARLARREMFSTLRGEMTNASFLFLGFSLNDPNFGTLHDDIRVSLGMNAPVSYTVQARQDSVKDQYLGSLGIETIWIDDWNHMPDFLRRIRPSSAS